MSIVADRGYGDTAKMRGAAMTEMTAGQT